MAPGKNLPERHLHLELDVVCNFAETSENCNYWVIQFLRYNGDWILAKLAMAIVIAARSKNTKASIAKIGTLNFILLNVRVVLLTITTFL